MFDKVWPILSLCLYLFNLAVAVYISILLIYHKRDPIKALVWVLVLLFLPYVGLVFYLLFGRNIRKSHIYSRKGRMEERTKNRLMETQVEIFANPIDKSVPEVLRRNRKLILLNLNNGKNILTRHNRVDCFFTGRSALDAMYKAASEAKSHIHLQSYIIENDAHGTYWKNLLISKAKAGVSVRIMYDGFGTSLPKSYLDELRKAGAQVRCFSPVRLPFLSSSVNYRNHRKILVVDGKIGFLGGVNIADRYYNGGDFPLWRDTQILIEGDAVASLQASFLMDWQFIKKRSLEKREQFYYLDSEVKNECPIQIISSGPDTTWANIMQSFLTAINQAQKQINVVSPYFVPSASLMDALRVAALGGVEVRILIPERSDSVLTQWSTFSYISELLEAGAKVYMFKKGFIHSKVISIDGEFCFIGSANFDNRSFEHNFEVGAMIYNRETTEVIENQFNKDISQSYMVNEKIWSKRSRSRKVEEAIGRLFSPLL